MARLEPAFWKLMVQLAHDVLLPPPLRTAVLCQPAARLTTVDVATMRSGVAEAMAVVGPMRQSVKDATLKNAAGKSLREFVSIARYYDTMLSRYPELESVLTEVYMGDQVYVDHMKKIAGRLSTKLEKVWAEFMTRDPGSVPEPRDKNVVSLMLAVLSKLVPYNVYSAADAYGNLITLSGPGSTTGIWSIALRLFQSVVSIMYPNTAFEITTTDDGRPHIKVVSGFHHLDSEMKSISVPDATEWLDHYAPQEMPGDGFTVTSRLRRYLHDGGDIGDIPKALLTEERAHLLGVGP